MPKQTRERREVWQLLTRLSGTLAVGGVLLGLIGSWAAAYAAFALGGCLAIGAWLLVRRRERDGRPQRPPGKSRR